MSSPLEPSFIQLNEIVVEIFIRLWTGSCALGLRGKGYGVMIGGHLTFV